MNSIKLVQVPKENRMEHALLKAGSIAASFVTNFCVINFSKFLWRLRVFEPFQARTDLSTNENNETNSIENKIPCLIRQDMSVDELQGYKCWAAGWGKTSQNGSGAHSTRVSF